MLIKSISLTNFRNYESFSCSFNQKGNVFCGKNGIGKTNLLEAICYFAFGKSFRSTGDTDLINYNADFFRIQGLFVHNQADYTFEAAVNRKGTKLIKINHQKLARISDLYKLLKIVFFSQQDINLIDGTPKSRRHFFDLAVSQSNYRYIEALKRYQQTVKQRNALLKDNFNPKEKKIWDEQLVENAASVIKYRTDYLKLINEEIVNPELVYNKELMKIKYRFSFSYKGNTPLIERLQEELIKVAEEERYQQRTLFGPHLADYQFILNDRPINKFGSHGQKRTFVIMMGLAHSRLIAKNDKEYSIMIFDDVLSDLDERRTQHILSSLSNNNQIFIGTPTPKLYIDLKLPLINLEEYPEKP